MGIATYDDLATSFRGLAFHKLDVATDFADATARALLAHLPGATFGQWERYAEAVQIHWDVKDGGDVPDSYLDDTLRRLARFEVRDVVLFLLERDRDELLAALMAHYPTLRAVAS